MRATRSATQARQGRLDLMYAYYKDHEPESAIDAAETSSSARTLRIRAATTHTTSRGWCISSARRTILERWLSVDLSERPPSDARKSFAAFQTVVTNYPKSEYAHDAHLRLIYLRNRLANYEVHVARLLPATRRLRRRGRARAST